VPPPLAPNPGDATDHGSTAGLAYWLTITMSRSHCRQFNSGDMLPR